MYIRKAKDAEIGLLADMTRQLFEDEPSDRVLTLEQFEDRLRQYINTGCSAFIFYEDDVVGYALVNLGRTPHYLIDFFVHRSARRGGKGTAAFHLLLRELGTEHLDLGVFCWNTRGRRFWESLGFKEHAVIMRR